MALISKSSDLRRRLSAVTFKNLIHFMQSEETLVKLLLIGESAVGKSCLLLRFAENKFQESFLSTIGIDFKVRHVEINDTKVKLQIWDTAGQEKFRTITKAYYRGAHGIMLVFDVTNVDTFTQTRQWINSIHENVTDPVAIILIGNKVDMEGRKVTKEQAQALADEFKVEYFETSAKDGSNVESTFFHLATVILNDKQMMTQLKLPTAVPVGRGSKSTQEKGCC
jgi:small GTP-binding protein